MPLSHYLKIGIVIFGLFIQGCAAPPKEKALREEILLNDLCRQFAVEWKWDSLSQVVTLTHQGQKAKAMMGSGVVIIANEKINLSAPLKRRHGVVVVPADFKRKVIDRLVQELGYVRKFSTVVVDAGHGGKDPGTIGATGLREKIVVLDIAKRLKNNLEEKGIKVIMTREDDQFIPLEERVRRANRSKADLFVSVHANSNGTRGIHGLEVYFARNLDSVTRREVQETANHTDAFRRFTMRQDDSVLKGILFDMLYTQKQYESPHLAFYLNRHMPDTIASLEGRGSRSSGFFVLKHTLISAVLVEVGYLSNRSEEALLATTEYRAEIAESLAKSIIQYANQ